MVSVTHPARPAPSTARRALRGKSRTIQFQMFLPSMRMNRVVNRVRSRPARKWPAVEPTESAPVIQAWLSSWMDRTSWSPYWVIWSSVRCSGDSSRNCLNCVPGHDALALQIGEPAADLRDDEHDQAGDDADQADLGDGDREPLRPPMPLQELRERHEQRGEQGRHHQRDDDEPELDDQET